MRSAYLCSRRAASAAPLRVGFAGRCNLEDGVHASSVASPVLKSRDTTSRQSSEPGGHWATAKCRLIPKESRQVDSSTSDQSHEREHLAICTGNLCTAGIRPSHGHRRDDRGKTSDRQRAPKSDRSRDTAACQRQPAGNNGRRHARQDRTWRLASMDEAILDALRVLIAEEQRTDK